MIHRPHILYSLAACILSLLLVRDARAEDVDLDLEPLSDVRSPVSLEELSEQRGDRGSAGELRAERRFRAGDPEALEGEDDELRPMDEVRSARGLGGGEEDGEDEEPEAVDPGHPTSLPTGEDRSAVTPQALSLPEGGGTIEGMGESFQALLSSGQATFSVPFALPDGRAGTGASLG
jgi:hypothetical protein